MKAIIPESNSLSYNPNRAQRRRLQERLNRGAKRKITKEEFEKALMIERFKHGDIRDNDVKTLMSSNVKHYDNEELFPDGTPVKLNYDNIVSRKHEDFTEDFWSWIEKNKDREFHLFREENKDSLVCLEEDVHYGVSEDEEHLVVAPKWLFDLFSDLLVKDKDGNWTEPFNIEGSLGDFVELAESGPEEK